MKRAIVVALGIALSLGSVLAQTPPPPKQGGGSGSADPNQTGTLQAGATDARPWAQGVSKDKQDAAIKLFQDGNGYLNDGIFPKAVETYTEALKFWDHPAIHYNMALALVKLEKPIEVEIHLQKAIAYGAAPLETEDKFEHAKEYLQIMAKELAWIEVTCDKVGAKVLVDGKEVFVVAAGKPNRWKGRVLVGKHTIIAEKTGYNAQVDAPLIEPGQNFAIDLKLYTSEELTRYHRKWNAVWMPFVVIGGGALVGLGGALFENSAQSSYDKFDKQIARCNSDSMNMGCPVTSSLTDVKKSGDTKQTLGYIGYGVAGAALVTGVVLLYVNRETSYEITADQYKKELREGKVKPKHSAAITPLVAPGTAGAMVFGRF